MSADHIGWVNTEWWITLLTLLYIAVDPHVLQAVVDSLLNHIIFINMSPRDSLGSEANFKCSGAYPQDLYFEESKQVTLQQQKTLNNQLIFWTTYHHIRRSKMTKIISTVLELYVKNE